MKTKLILFACIGALWLNSCKLPENRNLSEGELSSNWKTEGNVLSETGVLSLTGEEALALLKGGDYRDFDLSMVVRTSPGGKGYIGFHTDKEGKDGYRVAINNDREDAVWWRMTGSLLSVRNLTKSFVGDEEWFNMRIRVEGQLVSVSINDEPVVEYIEPAEPYRTEQQAKTLLSKGKITLVSTGTGKLEFKEMHLKTVDRQGIDIQAQLQAASDEQTDEIIRLHQEDFPVLDYHVHLKGGLTKEAAAVQSRKTGINYVVAPNCGVGFQITSNQEVIDYLDTMRTQPFILAMQGEGREWVSTFSQEVRDEFDFVFTDALTFTDHKGRRVRLWINDEVLIDNEQRYMDMIVDRTCEVLKEPVDIFVNPFFLPEAMSDRYDEFWTEARMDKVIKALAESGKALEINELYRIPNKAILLKAKEAGVKFSFGSNNVTPDVSKLEYSIRMKKECGLTPSDMYKPKIKIRQIKQS